MESESTGHFCGSLFHIPYFSVKEKAALQSRTAFFFTYSNESNN